MSIQWLLNFCALVRTWNPCNNEPLMLWIRVDDTHLMETMAYTKAEIVRVFNVPAHLL